MNALRAIPLIGSIRRPDEIRLLFEIRDLWIGVYWTRTMDATLVYICLAPCLPIRLTWYGGLLKRILQERDRQERMTMHEGAS